MTLLEIEEFAKKIFGNTPFSVRQINSTTIRISLGTDTFIDIFQSVRDPKKFAFHAKLFDGGIYRLDCRPEKKYKKFLTFPWHFHDGSEEHVVVSPFATTAQNALQQFLRYIKKRI